MQKKSYVLPEIKTARIATNGILLRLSPIVFAGPDNNKSETTCPFNNQWCVEKQIILDEWTNAVKLYAKQGKNYMFHTCGDMFDGCPMNLKSLCAEHKTRQRG